MELAFLYKVGRNDLPEAVSPAEGTTAQCPWSRMCLSCSRKWCSAGVPGAEGAAESHRNEGSGQQRREQALGFTPSEMRREMGVVDRTRRGWT